MRMRPREAIEHARARVRDYACRPMRLISAATPIPFPLPITFRCGCGRRRLLTNRRADVRHPPQMCPATGRLWSGFVLARGRVVRFLLVSYVRRRLVRLAPSLPVCGCVRSCFRCGFVPGLFRRVAGCRDPGVAPFAWLRLVLFLDRVRRSCSRARASPGRPPRRRDGFGVRRGSNCPSSSFPWSGSSSTVESSASRGLACPRRPILFTPVTRCPLPATTCEPRDRRRSRNESACSLVASAVAAVVSSRSPRTESPSSAITGDEARNSDPCASRFSGPLGDCPPAPAIFIAIFNWCVRPSRYPAPTAAATSTFVLVFMSFMIVPTCCVLSPRTASGVESMWNYGASVRARRIP